MEEQKTKKKSLNVLLMKNTVAILIPTIIVFGIVFCVTYFYPIVYHMTCRQIGTLKEMQEWYDLECYNVRMNGLQLRYTGYDYYEDGKQTGAYYYAFMEEECVFFLMKTKEPEPLMESVNIKGRLLKNSAGLDAMKGQFAEELGIETSAFESFVNPIMISEIDYPYLEIFLMWLLIIIPYIITVTVIVMSIIWTIQPFRHPSCNALNYLGDRRLVYDEIKSQFKNRMIQHKYNYYLTDEYLIINHWAKTDFIRVDFIRYVSLHVMQKMNGKKQVYRLSMSNPQKMVFEEYFDSKECADEIMEALIKLNPKLGNRNEKPLPVKMEEEQSPVENQEQVDEIQNVSLEKVEEEEKSKEKEPKEKELKEEKTKEKGSKEEKSKEKKPKAKKKQKRKH